MRSRIAPLAVALLSVLVPAFAHAGGTALYAGAGPRFSEGDTATVGALRLTYEVEAQLSLAIEVDAYLSAPATSSALDFAGGQAGLLVDLPIPGPITPELGLALGLVELSRVRHGLDDTLFTINGEIALRAALGPVKLRAAWTTPLWTEDEALTSRALDSQLVFSLGVGF
ncbi:MAG: hypothetical protein CVU56_18055 [Deltaproteobacteria bacterium HGW-Deltaproteobacteria-14]|jgi:hypothetical protein|nr:MAG: hypothetical protein CVU56_18055 [Deltaproteobacteria bacterium HGW-Deltaproteobacteria-14]